jgi:hypothetical protein
MELKHIVSLSLILVISLAFGAPQIGTVGGHVVRLLPTYVTIISFYSVPLSCA